jgi:very-short-patch-repair endonuclease
MRAAPTAFEKRLWKALRELNAEVYHFRRQVPFRGFILDYAEHGAKLVIELDGSSHLEEDARTSDEQRDAVLEKEGYFVLRIDNGEIAETLDPVLEQIRRVLRDRANVPPTRNAARSDLPTRGRFIWDAKPTSPQRGR